MSRTKYRGLTWDKMQEKYRFVYGLPSYGLDTEEIEEMGTVYGDFSSINPETLGKYSGYEDKNKNEIYVGDLTELETADGKRIFEVVETDLVREFNTLPGYEGDTVRVCLNGVIAFKWLNSKDKPIVLPCVDSVGICDTEKMEVIGNVYGEAGKEAENG